MPITESKHPYALQFGAIIRRLRQQRGWTIRRLAQRSGLNANYLGSMEIGGNTPSIATLFALAEVLGVRAADIVDEVERTFHPRIPPTPPPPAPKPESEPEEIRGA